MPSSMNGVGDESPPRLEVRILGAVEVILDGRRIRSFDSLRLQRFLAMVALRGDAQHRSRLAYELWPDSDERQARTNLRKLLHELRHGLPDVGEFVDIDNETVHWNPAGPSRVDALKFREAVAAGNLELAAQLYSGDLLPACYDDWILNEREKLRGEAHAALVQLTRQAAQRDEYTAAVKHARRVLDLEPADEAIVQIQMQAHLSLGDRTAALRSYHRYAEALERDFESAPGEAIRNLYRQIRGGSPANTGAHDIHETTESPFVGRGDEWRGLCEAWNLARQGAAHLLLISGEPGIGKSRLAQELGRRVRAENHLVASSRAYEAAGRLPWGPVVDLLRAQGLRGHVETLDAAWRNELARLMPELCDAEQSPDPDLSGGLARRHRLFDAARRAITAGNRPRLLIVDDLQWCDTETIELIGFVVRSGQTAPILIVGTVRAEEISPHHPLTRLIDALSQDRAVTTLALERFDETTTATLAARLHGRDRIDPALAARIWSETEGNPLFVIEALRAGLSADGDQAVLTPTMRAVLRARLAQLSDGARRIAETASVIGRPFSVDLLVAATAMDESELVDDLDELWHRRIIRDQGATYDFSHDKLRSVALELISPARRRQLHRAVAKAIETQFHADMDAALPQLAAHYDQAGMVEPAIDAYRESGTRAVAVSALDEAVTQLRRALALLAELPPTSRRDLLELEIRIALGSPLVALEGYGSRGAHQLYERALALCGKLGRPVNPPILRGLGLARLQGCCFDDCSHFGQALLEHESRDPVARTEGRYLLGVSAFWQGDLARARDHLEGAIAAYDASHSKEHMALYAQDPKAVCLVRLALVELWSGNPGSAGDKARAAFEMAVDLDHLMTRWYVVTYAAILAAEAEDFKRLAELLAEADRLRKRIRMPYLGIVLDALRGWLEVSDGAAEGIERIMRAVADSRTDGETLHLSYTLLLLARARGVTGAYRQGRAAAREGISLTNEYDQRFLEAELNRIDGELAYGCGDSEAAAVSLHAAVDTAALQGASWLELKALNSLATRFPDQSIRQRLRNLVDDIPSGHDLAPFRAAKTFLQESA